MTDFLVDRIQDEDDGDLDQLVGWIWAALSSGVHDRGSPFRTMTAATVDAAGRPHARIVVLRRADRAERIIEFHTDLRSRKIGHLEGQSATELLFWDADAAVQIRCRGQAEVLKAGHPATASALAPIPAAGRAKYRVDPAPGTAIADPRAVTTADAGTASLRFVLIRVRVEAIDYLRLAEGGQRRASFDLRAGGSGTWIAP